MDPSVYSNDNLKQMFKNPIGLMGFIMMVFEAIVGAVLTIGLKNLHGPLERLPIIVFIVYFPFCVLLVFVLLVVFYHTHLYAPSDYQNEANFVRLSGVEIEKQWENEAKEIVEEESKEMAEEESKDIVKEKAKGDVEGEGKKTSVVFMALAKDRISKSEAIGLALADRYFQVSLQKDVSLRSPMAGRFYFDGMAFKGNTLYAVEVKLLPQKGWKAMFERSLTQMQRQVEDLKRMGYKVEAMLVIVPRGKPTTDFEKKVEAEFYKYSYDFLLRVSPEGVE